MMLTRDLSRISRRDLTVDTHTHFLPLAWPDWAKKHGGDEWPWMRATADPTKAMLMQGTTEFRPASTLKNQ